MKEPKLLAVAGRAQIRYARRHRQTLTPNLGILHRAQDHRKRHRPVPLIPAPQARLADEISCWNGSPLPAISTDLGISS